jgi:sporulation protein YlmC with PRC-barrel domain
MPFLGELFISEILKKPVLDPKGDELGRVKDLVIVRGEPLPKVSSLIIEKKRVIYNLPWLDLNIFNKRIISANIYSEALQPYELNEEDLLLVRDILDKQIVDINGAKVVRVNDVKLEDMTQRLSLLLLM